MAAGAFLVLLSGARGENRFDLGGRYHQDHSVFGELPYGDGDLSYAVGYEYGEEMGAWQLALDWAPHVTGTSSNGVVRDVDSTITPQVNLLLRDKLFELGVGGLISYLSGDDSDWTDVYWQFIAGLRIPLSGGLDLALNAYYPFDEWGHIKEFEAGDIDYGLWLSFRF